MSTADTRDRLAEELTGPIDALGLDLEAVDLTSAGKRRVLRVAIDKDGGVTMDDIADATREVSRVLDDTERDGRAGLHPRGVLARASTARSRCRATGAATPDAWSR